MHIEFFLEIYNELKLMIENNESRRIGWRRLKIMKKWIKKERVKKLRKKATVKKQHDEVPDEWFSYCHSIFMNIIVFNLSMRKNTKIFIIMNHEGCDLDFGSD